MTAAEWLTARMWDVWGPDAVAFAADVIAAVRAMPTDVLVDLLGERVRSVTDGVETLHRLLGPS